MARRIIFFGDVHIPHHDRVALSVFCRAIAAIKPDEIVCVGDLLDATAFATYPSSLGVKESMYYDDIDAANRLLDTLGRHTRRLVFIEGNHEHRIRRWAANTKEGKHLYSLISPEKLLRSQTTQFLYLRYGISNNRYPMYKPNNRIVVVHGWYAGLMAARRHLLMAQGKSVVFGHIHRLDVATTQSVYSTRRVLEARSTGCLCQARPFWGEGNPVDWVHGFVLGFLGRHTDTLYSIPITKHSCVLPDGREIIA